MEIGESKIQEEASGTSEENIIFYRNYRGVISDSDNIFSCSDASKSTGMVYDCLFFWCTIVCLCVVLGAVVLNLVISRKLRKIEDL